MAKLHSLRFTTILHAIAFTAIFYFLSSYLQTDFFELGEPLTSDLQTLEWPLP
ncbi:hypothetical protein [Sphaerothrix gracilis]|uniref:hypothetical protein n=1 Tax=Sphaerothrix gracilis TaxID=3151835 RepID=UPI0031FC63BA